MIIQRRQSALGAVLLVYLAASLLHFVHNAEYLGQYPNLPTWLGRSDVYLAWLGLAALGAVGYALYRTGWQLVGLFVLALNAALGFDGLLHYTHAPFTAHTAAMNFTIWFEVLAAAILLIFVMGRAVQHLRHQA